MKWVLGIFIWIALLSPINGQRVSVQIPEDFWGNQPYRFLGVEKSLSLSSSVYYFDDPQSTYDTKQILEPEIQQLFRLMKSTPELLPEGTHWFRLDIQGNQQPFQEYLLA